ncbi:histidine phosphatase family protein [Nanoarchaeota archaeon]
MELIVATPGTTRGHSPKAHFLPKILESNSNLFPTEGIDQSKKLAKKLSHICIDYIISSDYHAATQTVDIIAHVHRPPLPPYDPDEVLNPFPTSQKEEHFQELQEFYAHLRETHPEQAVLLVTFDQPGRILSCLAQGKSLEKDLGQIPLLGYGEFSQFTL